MKLDYIVHPTRGTNYPMAAQSPMRGVRFGGDHDPGGMAVESVDDAGTCEFLADTGERAVGAVLEVPGESVDERARKVTPGRVDNDVVLLVDDDEIVILKENVQGEFLSRQFVAWRRGDDDRDPVAQSESGRGLGNAVVDDHRLLSDQTLERSPGDGYPARNRSQRFPSTQH